MKKLTYVNVHGNAVDPAYLPRAQPKPKATTLHRTEDLFAATKHFGFEVVGISEASLQDAAHTWHSERDRKGLDLAEFDREAFINRTKPKCAISRVFQVPEAAEQAAGMLRAGGGWHRVQVVAILKA